MVGYERVTQNRPLSLTTGGGAWWQEGVQLLKEYIPNLRGHAYWATPHTPATTTGPPRPPAASGDALVAARRRRQRRRPGGGGRRSRDVRHVHGQSVAANAAAASQSSSSRFSGGESSGRTSPGARAVLSGDRGVRARRRTNKGSKNRGWRKGFFVQTKQCHIASNARRRAHEPPSAGSFSSVHPRTDPRSKDNIDGSDFMGPGTCIVRLARELRA